MPYQVINEFIDTQDKHTHYKVGEEYPKGDYKPTKKRINELLKEHPKYKQTFIEVVKTEE